MEALPKIVRKRLRSEARAGAHPHADLLTAFAEKTLTERERTRVMEHLSRCEDCREVMFLSAPQPVPAQIVGKIPSRAGWLSWPVLRWGAVAACVVVVGTAITLRHLDVKRSALYSEVPSEKTQSVATNISPAAGVVPPANRDSSAESRKKIAQPIRSADANNQNSEDKLVAKLEAPARPQPRAMSATPQFQVQLDQAQAGNGDAVAAKETWASSVGGNAVAGARMAAVPAPSPSAPAPLAKDANPVAQAESDQKQAPGGSASGSLKVPAVSETVEVQASSPPVQTESAPVAVAKSKDASEADLPIAGRNMQDLTNLPKTAARGSSSTHYTKRLALALAVPAHWMLTPGGALQRSLDAGKTWQTVPVADKVSFQTFAAIASDVWVGGANGVLYHSSDAGMHWSQVTPKTNGESLTAGITHIEFSDAQNGKLTTSNGETWTTSDTGQTWHKN